MYTGGLDSHQKLSPTETPVSRRTLGVPWLTKLGLNKTCRPHSTPKLMDSQSARTNGSNNTYASLQTLNKKTGANGSQWQPQYIMITSMPPWGWPQVKFYWGTDPLSIPIKTFHQTIRWRNNEWKRCIRNA